MTNFYTYVTQCINEKKEGWIVTIIENSGSIPGKTGMKMLVLPDKKIYGTIGGGLLEHIVIERIVNQRIIQPDIWNFELNEDFEKKVGMICGGSVRVLVEPLLTGKKLYIFGGGHCSMALSALAAQCGFLPVVCDDRKEWASFEKHPSAHEVMVIDYHKIEQFIPVDPKSYYVIMTHGHRNDEVVLKQLMSKETEYLGMIGSKQKVNITFSHLIEEGIDESLLNKVIAPIGLPIGSHEPMEVAVSIVAQLIQIKNTKKNS